MIKLLKQNWIQRIGERSQWNPANGTSVCLANIIDDFATELPIDLAIWPADSLDLYNSSDSLNNITNQDWRNSFSAFQILPELGGLTGTLEKLRELAKSTRQSAHREEFQAIVKEHLNSELVLKLDSRERCHSTTLMLERSLQLRECITTWVSRHDELKYLLLSEQEWTEIKLLFGLMFPFSVAALTLSQTKGLTSHLAFGLYNYLFEHINNAREQLLSYNAEEANHFERIQGQLVSALDQAIFRLSQSNAAINDPFTYVAAALLTPSIKGSLFRTPVFAVAPEETPLEKVYSEQLMEMFEKYYVDADTSQERSAYGVDHQHGVSHVGEAMSRASPQQPVSNTQSILFGKIPEAAQRDKSIQELIAYLAEPPINTSLEVYENGTQSTMQFWQSKEKVWPTLTRMARDVLATPATSLDAQALDLAGRNIVNNNRHETDASKFTDIIFYRESLDRERKQRKHTKPVTSPSPSDLELLDADMRRLRGEGGRLSDQVIQTSELFRNPADLETTLHDLELIQEESFHPGNTKRPVPKESATQTDYRYGTTKRSKT